MMQFLNKIKQASKLTILNKNPIHILANNSIEGILSSAILIKAFERKKITFSLSTIKKISESFLTRLKNEQYENYIIIDLAIEDLDLLTQILSSRKVLVIGYPETKAPFFILNPEEELSVLETVYLLAVEIDDKNKDLSYLKNLSLDYKNEIDNYLKQNKPSKAIELCLKPMQEIPPNQSS